MVIKYDAKFLPMQRNRQIFNDALRIYDINDCWISGGNCWRCCNVH